MKELIILAIADWIPLTIVCRVLVVVAKVFVVLLALIAARLAFAAGDNTSGPVIVVVPFRVDEVAVSGPLILVVARLVVPVALKFPVFVVPKLPTLANRLVKVPVTPCIILVTIDARVEVPATFKLVPAALIKFKLSVLVVLALSVFAVILLAIILAAVVVPSNEILLNPLIVVVETIPSTIEVIRLVVDEKLRLLVVVAAISDAKLEVEITPLILVVMIPVEVAKVTELFEIIVLVPIDPPTLLVNILPALVNVLLVFKLFTDRFVAAPLVTNKFVPVALLNNRLEILALSVDNIFVKKLVVVALLNITLSLKVYFTSPDDVVDTVKLLLVEEAKKLNKLLTDVVANTPLILVVTIPAFADILFELIKLDVELIPFTDEVKVLITLLKLLLLIRLPVVVAITPLTIEVNVKLFVLVDITSVLLVDEATRL